MVHHSRARLSALALVMLGTGTASALPPGASTTSLHGRILTGDGGGISGADITLTPFDGTSSYVEQSNPGGVYYFHSLPAGNYSVTITAQDFVAYPNPAYDRPSSDQQYDYYPPGPPTRQNFVLHPPSPI